MSHARSDNRNHLEVMWLVKNKTNKHRLLHNIIMENLLYYKCKKVPYISQTIIEISLLPFNNKGCLLTADFSLDNQNY